MDPDNNQNDEIKEFRLEGLGLILVCAAAVIALAIAFYLGMRWERGSHPTGIDRFGPVAGETEGVETGEVEAEEGLTHFDTLDGSGKEAEPGREARIEPEPAETGVQPSPPPPADTGKYYVQVFAGRDRTSAERLVSQLKEKGFPVRMNTLREGQGALYKVKVGGYPDRETAAGIAEQLKSAGFPGAWIPPVD
jgi:hypothetical protein